MESANAGAPVVSGSVNEVRGLGMLLAALTDRIIAPVEGMHRAIAGRAFGVLGEGAAPVRRIHDTISGVVYGSVRLAGSALGAAVTVGGVAVGGRRDLRPLSKTAGGSAVLAALNGYMGDRLKEDGNDLCIEMGLRDLEGDTIAIDGAALASRFPAASGRIAVLVHGLGETERCWRNRDGDGTGAPEIGERLAADLGFTPIAVRYNSGLRVSRNGADLNLLLERLVAAWPTTVDDIVLVGHSMGGLVVRSAAHIGHSAESRWVDVTRHIVTLGTPHLGAPLEKAVHLAARGLRVAPEVSPLADLVDARSAGIKDLRHGAVMADDGDGGDPNASFASPVGVPAPIEHVAYHFVASAVTADPDHPVGYVVGDLLVRVPSGTGRGRRRRVQATNVRVFGGRNHFDLLRDPVVHDQVVRWLAG